MSLQVIKLSHKWVMAHQLKAHCLMASLGCQLDSHLKSAGHAMPVRIFTTVLIEVERRTLTLGHTFFWNTFIRKDMEDGSFGFFACLPWLSRYSSSVLVLRHWTYFFRIPTQTEDWQSSRNPLGFQYQIGTLETSSLPDWAATALLASHSRHS